MLCQILHLFFVLLNTFSRLTSGFRKAQGHWEMEIVVFQMFYNIIKLLYKMILQLWLASIIRDGL